MKVHLSLESADLVKQCLLYTTIVRYLLDGIVCICTMSHTYGEVAFVVSLQQVLHLHMFKTPPVLMYIGSDLLKVVS